MKEGRLAVADLVGNEGLPLSVYKSRRNVEAYKQTFTDVS